MQKYPVPRVHIPMPVTIVGSYFDEQTCFQTTAWVNRVNYKPNIFALGINPRHLTAQGIEQNKMFSINVPSKKFLEETDFAGIYSSNKYDKTKLFNIREGESLKVPIIEDFSFSFELELIKSVQLQTNTVYFGEVKEAWVHEDLITDGILDFSKSDFLLLSMPDNRYWSIGESIGNAWSDGNKDEFKEKCKKQLFQQQM